MITDEAYKESIDKSTDIDTYFCILNRTELCDKNVRKEKLNNTVIDYKNKNDNLNVIIYIQSYAEDIIEELLNNTESNTFQNLIEFTKQIEVIIKFHAINITSTQHTIAIEPLIPFNIKSLNHQDRVKIIKRIERTRKIINENGLKFDKVINTSTITKFLSLHSYINFQPNPTESMENYVSILTNSYRSERVTDETIQSLKDVIPDIFSKERSYQIKKTLIGNVLIALCKRKQQVILKHDPESLKITNKSKIFALSYDQLKENKFETESKVKREDSTDLNINIKQEERFQEDLDQMRIELKNDIYNINERISEIESDNISIKAEQSSIRRDYPTTHSASSQSDDSSSDREGRRRKRKKYK